VPKGFSTIMRAPWARPVPPSTVTAGSNAAGGTARWKSRRGEPPSSSLARWIAAASGALSAGCELPN
jgi:hypothetical protein